MLQPVALILDVLDSRIHTFASLLLQDGTSITNVSRQLGHKDASITLRVYAHWLPDPMNQKLVDTLDDAAPRGPQTAPAAFDHSDQRTLSALNGVVSRIFASWNQLSVWLRQLADLRRVA